MKICVVEKVLWKYVQYYLNNENYCSNNTTNQNLRACLVNKIWSLNFRHSISITHHSSLITQFFTFVCLHHSVSITHYFSHYLEGPRLSRCNFFFFFFHQQLLLLLFSSWVGCSVWVFFFFFFFSLSLVSLGTKEKKRKKKEIRRNQTEQQPREERKKKKSKVKSYG